MPDADQPTIMTRHHCDDRAQSSAVYSACERYRYLLTRTWDASGPRLLFIMLNPSKATEVLNDPTIERCERRARALGFGAVRITNIFAWRDTDPRALKLAEDPVGPDNSRLLMDSVSTWLRGNDDHALCAWGAHGTHLGRGPATEAVLRDAGRDLWALGLTKAGHPAHPLYIAYAQKPFIWQVAANTG